MRTTKKLLSITFALLVLCVCLLMIAPTPVNALGTFEAPKTPSIQRIVEIEDYVVVKWDRVDCNGYEIQYSDTSTFSNPTTVRVGQGNTMYKIKNTLRPNIGYYFRMRSFNSSFSTEYSDWSNIKIFTYKLPTSSFIDVTLNENVITFNWNKPSTTVSGYEIEYGPNSTFTNAQRLSVQVYDTTTFKLGSHQLNPNVNQYFRIRTYKTVDGRRYYSTWSGPTIASYNLTAPNPIIIASVSDSSIKIRWTKVSGSDTIIQISDSSTFADVLFEYKTSEERCEIPKGVMTNKTYYVRACADLRGFTSQWSDLYKFTYQMSVPTLNAFVNGNKVEFDWKSANNTDGYKIECCMSPSFNQDVYVFEKSTAAQSTMIDTLPCGTWYARISLTNTVDTLDKDNHVNYSPWSSTAQFSLSPPRTNITNMNISDERIKLYWNDIDPNAGYEVQISNSSNFSSPITIQTTYDYCEFKNNLIPNTKYYVRVRAFSTLQSTSLYSPWSTVSAFTFQLRPTYIKTLKQQNNGIYVSWQTYNVYTGYEIQYLDANATSGWETINVLTSNAKDILITNRLLTGQYNVRIRGYKSIDDTKYYSNWSNIKTVTYNEKFEKTYIKTMYIDHNAIKVNWLPVDCAGYEIHYSKSSTFQDYKTIKISEHDVESCYINDVEPGVLYVKIRTYIQTLNGEQYSNWSNVKTITFKSHLPKTYLTNLYSVNETLKLSWKEIDSPDVYGYEIQYSNSPKFDDYVNTERFYNTDTECTIDDHSLYFFAPNYYVRIRTFKLYDSIDGKTVTHYSDWSNTKTVTFKLNKPYIKNIKVDEQGRAVVTMNSCDTCTYEIQISSDPTFPYPETNGASFTEIDRHNPSGNKPYVTRAALGPGTLYFRIRAFYHDIEGNEYYSEWSNTKSIHHLAPSPEIKELSIKYNKLYCKWTTDSFYDEYHVVCVGKDPKNSNSGIYLGNKNGELLINVQPDTYDIYIIGIYSDDNYYMVPSSTRSIEYKVSGTKLEEIRAVENAVELKWSKSSGCHGYQIQCSASEDFTDHVLTKLVWNTDTVNCAFNDMQKGQYYFRIRTYKEINNEKYYSEWSSIEMVTVN